MMVEGLLALLISGPVAPAATCPPPRIGWMPKGPLAGLRPPVDQVALGSDGRLRWNGRRITMSEFRHYLRLIEPLPDKPIVFFSPSPKASCDKIEAVRSAMDYHLGCRGAGLCGEGNLEEWQKMPAPAERPVS